MGMFDSFLDAAGNEWQTKALGRSLTRYKIGDAVNAPPLDHQMQILGGPSNKTDRHSFATIRNGRLAEVPAERDEALPMVDYFGNWVAESMSRQFTGPQTKSIIDDEFVASHPMSAEETEFHGPVVSFESDMPRIRNLSDEASG